MKNAAIAMAACLLTLSCTRHEIETRNKLEIAPVEVKPIHIIVDVNIKIQEELKKEFGKADNISKNISDDEAEAALQKYLESNQK
jgi:hypothetical protein